MIDDVTRILRGARKKKKLTLKDVSEATGLSISTISKIESGQRKLRNAKHIVAFSNVLGLDANELYKMIFINDEVLLYEAEAKASNELLMSINGKAQSSEISNLRQKIFKQITLLNNVSELETILTVVSSFVEKNNNSQERKEKRAAY